MHQIAVILTIFFALSCPPQDGGRVVDKIALENSFIDTISDDAIIPLPADSCYSKLTGNLYVIDSGSYMLEDVRSATYAVLSHGHLQPLSDWNRPKESVLTMLTTPSADGEIILDIDHIKYGFEKANYKIRLSSFLSSCILAGCVPYVGIETITDEAVTVSLFLVNAGRQYNHVLKLTIPKHAIVKRRGRVTGTLHTYVPMGNVSDLYAK